MNTLPPPLAAPPAPKWPKTIGIIAIVFSAGAILQGLVGPASLFLTRQQMKTFVDQGADQKDVDAYLAQLSSLTWGSAAVSIVLGLLLLTGGILLIRRRRIASPLLQTWACLKIIVGGFLMFKTMAITRLQMSIILAPTLAKSGGAGASEMQMVSQISSYAMWIGMAFGFIWLVLLPVFFIIWFNRRRTHDEMAGW